MPRPNCLTVGSPFITKARKTETMIIAAEVIWCRPVRGKRSGPSRCLAGELVGKQVAGRLAVSTGQREVVVRLLADAPGHTHDRECDHQPDYKDPHGVTGAKVTQTVEQWRQHGLLMCCGLHVLPRICFSIGSPNGSIHARDGAPHPSNGLVWRIRHQLPGFGCLLSSMSLEVSGRPKRSMVQSASTCARLRS
jgi:hypothetical protein